VRKICVRPVRYIFFIPRAVLQIRITLMRIRICGSIDPSFQQKAQSLEKVLKKAHIPNVLARHLQIDVNPDPDPAGPL
jgi:hypothetical protein